MEILDLDELQDRVKDLEAEIVKFQDQRRAMKTRQHELETNNARLEDVLARVRTLEARQTKMRLALLRISKPQGAGSSDRVTYLNNVIQAMVNLATEALKLTTEESLQDEPGFTVIESDRVYHSYPMDTQPNLKDVPRIMGQPLALGMWKPITMNGQQCASFKCQEGHFEYLSPSRYTIDKEGKVSPEFMCLILGCTKKEWIWLEGWRDAWGR